MTPSIQSHSVANKKVGFFDPPQRKKNILIAVATLMFLGMVLSYALGAQWFIIAAFFALSLSPLFPLGKAVDNQRSRIIN
ncbi:MAG: hypothetical protein WCF19_06660 [Chlamydiales bacterium]